MAYVFGILQQDSPHSRSYLIHVADILVADELARKEANPSSAMAFV